MTYDAIHGLLASAEAGGWENFWRYEGDFFLLFYRRFQHTPSVDIPDIPFLYIEMNNWLGMSLRCGVWQYYESGAF